MPDSIGREQIRSVIYARWSLFGRCLDISFCIIAALSSYNAYPSYRLNHCHRDNSNLMIITTTQMRNRTLSIDQKRIFTLGHGNSFYYGTAVVCNSPPSCAYRKAGNFFYRHTNDYQILPHPVCYQLPSTDCLVL